LNINSTSSLHTHTQRQNVVLATGDRKTYTYIKLCWLQWQAAGGTLGSFDIIKGHVKSIRVLTNFRLPPARFADRIQTLPDGLCLLESCLHCYSPRRTCTL